MLLLLLLVVVDDDDDDDADDDDVFCYLCFQYYSRFMTMMISVKMYSMRKFVYNDFFRVNLF